MMQKYYKEMVRNMSAKERSNLSIVQANLQKTEYYRNALNKTQDEYSKVKNQQGEELCLKIYFHKEYKKRSGEFKDFKLSNAKFFTQKEILKQDNLVAKQKKKAILKTEKEFETQYIAVCFQNEFDPYADGFSYEETERYASN